MDILFEPTPQEVEPIESLFRRSPKRIALLVEDSLMNDVTEAETVMLMKELKKGFVYKVGVNISGNMIPAVQVSTSSKNPESTVAKSEHLVIVIGANPELYPIVEKAILKYRESHPARIHMAVGYEDMEVDESLVEFSTKYNIEVHAEDKLATALYRAFWSVLYE